MIEWFDTPQVIVASVALLSLVGGFIYLVWRVARWTGSVDNKLSSLTENVREIRADIKRLFSALPPLPVAGSSPLRLTEFGEEIAANMNAKEWASGLKPELLPEVEGREPFEVDEFCRDYVQEKLPEEWRRKIAKYAYEFGIDKDGVEKVLTVVLREELLQA